MEITIYGTGCPKCKKLMANAEQAAMAAGVAATFNKVESVADIAKAGVVFTPAIAVDGVIKAAGKVVPPEKIAEWLK